MSWEHLAHDSYLVAMTVVWTRYAVPMLCRDLRSWHQERRSRRQLELDLPRARARRR